MSRTKLKPTPPTAPPVGPMGVWLIAGTTMNEPYPCRCVRSRSCMSTCACRGRTDTDHLPRYCCAKPKPRTEEDR